MQQMSLMDAVVETYSESSTGQISNETLYNKVAEKLNLSKVELKETFGKGYNKFKHKVRWVQQSLKSKALLTKISRGCWEFLPHKDKIQTAATEKTAILAASTHLGVVIWTKNKKVFTDMIDEPIEAYISSLPYPLKVSRAYGNPKIEDYIDFVCHGIEAIIPKLAKGGNIALNISNDIFMHKSPARSTYVARLIIALEDRLGLHYMDQIIWQSNKIPTPTYWACVNDYQLRAGYEPVLWFTNDPHNVISSNRRVLQPHKESHKKLIESGGLKKAGVNGDGAYIKRKGAFGNKTKGTIPTNVISDHPSTGKSDVFDIVEHSERMLINVSNYCASGRMVDKFGRDMSIGTNQAKMPLSLAEFLVQLLSRPGGLVVDDYSGSLTLGEAAEKHNRRYVLLEMVLEHIVSGFQRIKDAPGAWINPEIMGLPQFSHLKS